MAEITTKKKRQRQPKSTPYEKVNSYTHRPSKQQIITALIFVGLVAVHEVFITSSVSLFATPILWIILGFRYALLLLILHDYLKLTTLDPVDRLILDPGLRYKHHPYELRRCSICASTVQCSSHHCMTCNRCTEDFDHHCKYLNNCIGVRNYQYFIRLLIVFIVFSVLGIVMGAWLLIENSLHSIVSDTKKWVTLGYVILTALLALVVAGLLSFHIYISCCANVTTLQFITAPVNAQTPQLNVIVVEPTPLSAQNFRKTFQGHGPKHNYGLSVVTKDQPMEFYRK